MDSSQVNKCLGKLNLMLIQVRFSTGMPQTSTPYFAASFRPPTLLTGVCTPRHENELGKDTAIVWFCKKNATYYLRECTEREKENNPGILSVYV